MPRTLPLVLAGPMLRRSTPEVIYVWLCMSSPIPLKAEVYPFDKTRKSWDLAKPVGRSDSYQRVQVGTFLHFHLIPLRPVSRTFPVGEILGYDLRQGELGGAFDPKRKRPYVSALDQEYEGFCHGFGIAPFKLPLVRLQAKGEGLRVVYGSCRKLHGEGPDATLSLATWFPDAPLGLPNVAVTHDREPKLGQLPHALFFVGDQIYADDVSDGVAFKVDRLAAQLMSFSELLPGVKAVDMTFGAREKRLSSFTTDKKPNHLMRLGEYAAMYLIAWNSWFWERDSGSSTAMVKRSNVLFRRASANTPTYFLVDDHDITDDWNFDEKWEDEVAKGMVEDRVVTNALSAYWLFQGWGNNPDMWQASKNTDGSTMRDVVEKHVTNLMPNSPKPKLKPELGASAKPSTVSTKMQKEFDWSFVAPTSPETFFLDTRTKRTPCRIFNHEIASANDAELPPFIGRAILPSASDLRQLNSLKKLNLCVVVATPTPVFWLRTVDALSRTAAGTGSRYLELKYDLEGWNSNAENIVQFCKAIYGSKGSVVVVCGDLHYGFVIRSTLAKGRVPISGDLVILECTSSALRNELESLVFTKAVSSVPARGEAYHRAYWRDPSGRDAWTASWGGSELPILVSAAISAGVEVWILRHEVLFRNTRNNLGELVLGTDRPEIAFYDGSDEFMRLSPELR